MCVSRDSHRRDKNATPANDCMSHDIGWRYRSLLQKSPIKETIFWKKRPMICICVYIYTVRDIYSGMGWLRLVGSLKL